MVKKVPCVTIDGTTATRSVHEVIEEVPMALFVNGRHAMTTMIRPVQLEEFATGYLFTEQIITAVNEIESIRIEKNRMSVITTNLFRAPGPKKTILSGCGGSTSFINTEKLPKIAAGYTVAAGDIASALTAVLTSDLHALTGGIHIVALLDGARPLFVSEDTGRHNALDRVIGWGLINAVDLSRTYVIVAGRISAEMVRKCLVAGIPVLVSRGATTTVALDIAERTGLTVAGFAREEKMVVYTHPERISGVMPGKE